MTPEQALAVEQLRSQLQSIVMHQNDAWTYTPRSKGGRFTPLRSGGGGGGPASPDEDKDAAAPQQLSPQQKAANTKKLNEAAAKAHAEATGTVVPLTPAQKAAVKKKAMKEAAAAAVGGQAEPKPQPAKPAPAPVAALGMNESAILAQQAKTAAKPSIGGWYRHPTEPNAYVNLAGGKMVKTHEQGWTVKTPDGKQHKLNGPEHLSTTQFNHADKLMTEAAQQPTAAVPAPVVQKTDAKQALLEQHAKKAADHAYTLGDITGGEVKGHIVAAAAHDKASAALTAAGDHGAADEHKAQVKYHRDQAHQVALGHEKLGHDHAKLGYDQHAAEAFARAAAAHKALGHHKTAETFEEMAAHHKGKVNAEKAAYEAEQAAIAAVAAAPKLDKKTAAKHALADELHKQGAAALAEKLKGKAAEPAAPAPKPEPVKAEPPPPAAAAPNMPAHMTAPSIVETAARQPLSGGTSAVYKVTYQDAEGNAQHGVYKPLSGETQLQRASSKAGTYHEREAAAYDLDQLLGGTTAVPPTLSRVVGSEQGTFQKFVPNGKNGNPPEAVLDAIDAGHWDKIPPTARRAFLLDVLSGNDDRHAGNIMWTHDTATGVSTAHAIDNALSFTSKPSRFDLPVDASRHAKYAKLLSRLDEPNVAAVKGLKLPEVAAALNKRPGITPTEIADVLARVRSLQINQNRLSHAVYNKDGQMPDDVRAERAKWGNPKETDALWYWVQRPAADRVTSGEISAEDHAHIQQLAGGS